MSGSKARRRKAEKPPPTIYQLSWAYHVRRKWPHLRVIAPQFDYALQEFKKAQALKNASLDWRENR